MDDNKMPMIVIDPKGEVICDRCCEDYTKSLESGGAIINTWAYCPKCFAKSDAKPTHIKATCPEWMSFADWIRSVRGDYGIDAWTQPLATTFAESSEETTLTLEKLRELMESIKMPKRYLVEIRVSKVGKKRLHELVQKMIPSTPEYVQAAPAEYWGIKVYIDKYMEEDSLTGVGVYNDRSICIIQL